VAPAVGDLRSLSLRKSHQLRARFRARRHRVASAMSRSSRSSPASSAADGEALSSLSAIDLESPRAAASRRRRGPGRPPVNGASRPPSGAAAAAAAAAVDIPRLLVNGRDLASVTADASGVVPGHFFRGAAPRLQDDTSALASIATFVDLRTEEERTEERREAVAVAEATETAAGSGRGGGPAPVSTTGEEAVVPYLPRRLRKPLPGSVYLDMRSARGRRRKQKVLATTAAACAADDAQSGKGRSAEALAANAAAAAVQPSTDPTGGANVLPADAAADGGVADADAAAAVAAAAEQHRLGSAGGGFSANTGGGSSSSGVSTDTELSAAGAVDATGVPAVSSAVWVAVPLMASWKIGRALVRPFGRRDKVSCMARAAVKMSGGRERIVSEMDGRGLLGLNKILVDDGGEGVAAALRVVLAAHLPVLIFCTAGKDRTGLISALLLAVAGVDEAAIAADYARSEETYLGGGPAQAWYAERLGLVGLGLEEWMASPASVMADTFAYIRARHGSVPEYLTAIGFGLAEQHALRDKLRQ